MCGGGIALHQTQLVNPAGTSVCQFGSRRISAHNTNNVMTRCVKTLEVPTLQAILCGQMLMFHVVADYAQTARKRSVHHLCGVLHSTPHLVCTNVTDVIARIIFQDSLCKS